LCRHHLEYLKFLNFHLTQKSRYYPKFHYYQTYRFPHYYLKFPTYLLNPHYPTIRLSLMTRKFLLNQYYQTFQTILMILM